MSKILIIDDEAAIRSSLKEILEYEDHTVDTAEDGKEGVVAAAKGEYDIIFCDIKMPGLDGIEALEMMQVKGVEAPVIMISGHGTVETAVEALKKGAYDFIQKPLDLNRILVTLRNATETKELVEETKVLKKKINKKLTSNIVGESVAIGEIKQMMAERDG